MGIAALKSTLLSVLDKRLPQKYVVLESDDWGSVRMSNAKNRNSLVRLGHDLKNNPYHWNDGLETYKDIIDLGTVLSDCRSNNGSTAIITMNNSTANPDFEHIRKSGFSNFYRERFDYTYSKYNKSERVVELIKEGVNSVFDVQFHGAEHLNSLRWMNALRLGDKKVREAFEYFVFSPSVANETGYKMEYMDALDYDDVNQIEDQLEYLSVGLEFFRNVWGFDPSSFIAPCYRWSSAIERMLAENGIESIQGLRFQLHPKNKIGYKQRKVFHYLGQRNSNDQIYTVRNCFFEPSLHGGEKSIQMAKKGINSAFRTNTPAIISTHRINYTSRIQEKNKEVGLKAIEKLLKWIIQEYPDVTFVSSGELNKIIRRS